MGERGGRVMLDVFLIFTMFFFVYWFYIWV